jgi:cell division protein FtsA
VREQDVADLLREGCATVQDAQRVIIHCFPVEYRLDGARGIRDPLNMYGNTLGADLNIITADAARLKNLANCVNRCHLNIAEFVASQHASAYGCLEQDEMELGTTIIDMGGSETSFALFSNGRNIFSGSIPIGGGHVTSDIAQGLTTSIASAERIKVLQGSAIAAPKDAQVMIEIPQIGEEQEGDEPNVVPRSTLIAIIRPRLEEIFEMVQQRIKASGMEGRAGRHTVITGGASQMVATRDLAARVMNKQVRIARPRLLPGLADSVSGAPFSCAIGMLHFVNNRLPEDMLVEGKRRSGGLGSRTQKMMAWLRDNF